VLFSRLNHIGVGERIELFRKTVSGTMLILVILMLTLAFNIQPARASGTIYIRADGSIDPPTAPISSVDNITYTFTDNIFDSIVVERDNIILDGAGYTLQGTMESYVYGIDLSYTHSVTITDMNIKKFDVGIYLEGSFNNSIFGNNIASNGNGIFKSSNNTISGNSITASIVYGIWALSNNNISGNLVANNGDGIGLGGNNNIVSGNNITNNETGFHLLLSDNNIIFHNNFINNIEQAWLFDSYPNSWDDSYPSGGNYWSDYTGVDEKSGTNQDQSGSDGIGDTPYVIDVIDDQDNYPLMKPWPTRTVETTVKIAGKDYTITIESNITITHAIATKNTLRFTTSGPTGTTGYINVTFPMGLNTTEIKVFVDDVKLTPPPFPIITSNGTNYFIYFEFTQSTHNITMQYAIADIATTNITPAKTIVGQGYTIRINTTLQNQGHYTETFNVTTYANETIIATLTDITLSSGNSTTITFTWNTTGFAKGNYTISAVADIVPDETDTADNTLTDGWVLVTIIGDVNGDCKIDGKDIALIIKVYGSYPGHPKWDPNMDVNCDGKVDGRDIALAIKNYGKYW
jgi:parallel beta-helix repeat protein